MTIGLRKVVFTIFLILVNDPSIYEIESIFFLLFLKCNRSVMMVSLGLNDETFYQVLVYALLLATVSGECFVTLGIVKLGPTACRRDDTLFCEGRSMVSVTK
jgi:hypothetical protein